MNRATLFLILSSFLFATSCGPKAPSENEILRAEVMAVHDEVMPKIGELRSLQREALDKAEQLESEDAVDSLKVKEYKELAFELNHADESMFAWMRQYDTEDGERSEEELKEYLNNQLVLASEVNVEIKEVLAKADDMLN